MGLLTNPNTDDSNKISLLLHKYTGRIGIVSYIGGIVWFVFLANYQYNLGTYFSENALLPGLVVENFYDGHKAESYFQGLNSKEERNGHLIPEDFVEAFQNIGLQEIEEQNFTLYDPITKVPTRGTNVFAILRAKRSAGTESVIFNVPYFPGNSKWRKNTPAVALIVALAEYFSNQVYWAKDIVFLVAESHMGSLAWVKGHQEIRDSNKYLQFERVRNKAGNIQAAVNFVLESSKVCSLSTKFHGINGQLPNLDVVNLINKFVVTEYEKRANWEADFWKLVNYMKTQATGTTSGSHGYFLKYGIESVTLYGSKGGKTCRNVYSFGDIGRYIEATFRSLNNLLERLHQSFFFYLKTTPNRFISIGLYFPPLALIVFPILLKAASIWLTQNNLEITKALFIIIAVHTLAIGSRWALSNLDVFIPRTSDMQNETLKLIVLASEAFQFMGLLIDPNADNNKEFAKKLRKNSGPLSALCYVAGIIWLILLCDSENNKANTSLTDTALMPGLVKRNFQDGQKAQDYLQQLSSKESPKSHLRPAEFSAAFLKAGFQDIEEQNFTFYNPITKVPSFGTNVIGILRGRRSAGAESIVFNVPYFRTNPKGKRNTAAVALMMALAEYFSDQVYWAKDIIFLVADGHLGSSAFVKGHHEIQEKNKYLEVEKIRKKAGHVQTAVNFVMESKKICSLSAKFHGVNGQIPNLDMVNLVNKFVLEKENNVKNWEADFWKFADFIKIQATGSPTDSHGFFLQYGIQSVTMYGQKGEGCKQGYTYQTMGKYLEGIFRSLNGIVERLHQSFFFWFLTNPSRAITISLYFPPLALLLAPILLKPATIWLVEDNLELRNSLFITFTLYSIAIANRWILSNLDLLLPDISLMTNDELNIIFCSLSALQLLITLFLVRRSSPSQSLLNGLYCISTLQVATSLYCFALFNPSFVIIVGLCGSPIFSFWFFFEPVKRSAVFYVVMSVLVCTASYFYGSMSSVVAKYFYESEMYGNLDFDFVTLSLLPSLFILVSIL
ncbi:unnamed protein product [Allacma fusca]|uniref:Glycosylphosphatidylinositol anchor attachment 1 protein n=1 Tax=Allacma fusca TaxID=39272 RepID=A0A8J2KGI1_9HEXA|nr:unnamed protein product [Allacma fusca]